MLELNGKMGIRGLYTFTGVDTETKARRPIGVVKNLVTDWGFQNWGDYFLVAYCVLGGSNTEPTFGDEDLGEFLYSRGWSTNTTGFSESPVFGYARYMFTFPTGMITETIREIGIRSASERLVSHALMMDDEGNPIELNLSPTEELEILYEARSYPTLTDNVQYMTTKGVEYEIRLRSAAIEGGAGWTPGNPPGGFLCGLYNGPMGTIEGEPSGSVVLVNPTEDSYDGVEGTARIIVWDFKIPVNQANLAGGIRSALFMPGGKGVYQFEITPPLPKTSNDVFNFSIKFRWERL